MGRASFCGWVVLGAGYGIALLGLLTIGLFLLPVLALTTLLAAISRRFRSGWPGVISGTGLPLIWLAFANRSGPGSSCTTDGSRCVELYSPWPWLLVGLALVAVGLAVYRLSRPAASSAAQRCVPPAS